MLQALEILSTTWASRAERESSAAFVASAIRDATRYPTLAAHPRREPLRAFGTELGLGAALVRRRLPRGEHVPPAPVDALVDEHLGAAVTECAPSGTVFDA